VEKEIGEKRVMSFHGTGISVASPIDFQEIANAYPDPEEAKVAYTEALYKSVCKQYKVLNSAIHGKKGLDASTPTVQLSQSWL
jgi:glycerol-3-phosphate O-acyltransferase